MSWKITLNKDLDDELDTRRSRRDRGPTVAVLPAVLQKRGRVYVRQFTYLLKLLRIDVNVVGFFCYISNYLVLRLNVIWRDPVLSYLWQMRFAV